MIMHVLKSAGHPFDYLVGAKLNGFSQSVNITDAPVIICEGDEYPASVIEKRPKFHFLFPHIAIITGIAWDHINVFPTFDIYLEQFRLFINMIEPGGLLIYNESDSILKHLAEANTPHIRKTGYGVPEHTIVNGLTHIVLEGCYGPLKVFGDHNLLNMHAAFLACKALGVQAGTFVEAIGSFAGASKRLELLAANDNIHVYRDFAHAPSKVKATIEAVKQQFPDRKLIALLELHTYSSLNAAFMTEYKGAMAEADVPAVFYSAHALALKRIPALAAETVSEGFGTPGLSVLTDKAALDKWLSRQDYNNSNVLLMSSGNYDGLEVVAFAQKLVNGEAVSH